MSTRLAAIRAAESGPVICWPASSCSLCGLPYRGHPQCDGCHILVGPGHISARLVDSHGHRVCTQCEVRWKAMERKAGRPVTWLEFLKGE